MKEYIVVVRKGVDLDQFWTDMETTTHRCGCVPDRAVDIARDRPVFKRICEYWLTDAEAETLRADPRVLSVEIPFRNDPNTAIVSNTTQNVAGMNYNKQPGQITVNYNVGGFTEFSPANYNTPYNASTNWGLIRHSYQSDQYTGSVVSGYSTGQYYNYVIDGTGVDVIINDTGLQANHPEFAGRVTTVNWNSIAATVGASTAFNWNFYSYNDFDGHGTNVAGIAAGKTYGWAKGSNIIPLFIAVSLGQSSAEPLDMFEMMIYWHQNKGNSRPTVANMSWNIRLGQGVLEGTTYYQYITGGSYRGTPILAGQTNSYYQTRGLIGLSGQGIPVQGDPYDSFPYTSLAYNAALGEVIDSGIVVCQAAGNNGFKSDVEGGADYNNYVIAPTLGSSNPFYYHRGLCPTDPRAIVVGALDTVTEGSPAKDQRVGFSCAGPGVDIWAAGTYIMSACSNTSIVRNPDGSTRTIIPGAPYFRNTAGQNYREIVMSGTSQASPQVAGMSALYLQLIPPGNIYDGNNCSNVKSWLMSNAITNSFYATGNATTYTEQRSLLGGNTNVAYQNIQGLTWIKTDSSTWTAVANIHVKTDSSTWTESPNVVVKTNSTTWKPVFPVRPG